MLQALTTIGQYYDHHAAHTGSQQVSATEVANELRSRGYDIYVEIHVPPAHVPPAHELPALTKGKAIAVAVDVSIAAYNVTHTTAHPYRCPSPTSPNCKLSQSIWNAVVSYAVTLANGYLQGRYALPSWAGSYRVADLDLDDLYFGDVGAMGLELGGFIDWIQENPEILTILAGALQAAGQALTARRVAELLKANVPKDYLTKADLPQILQALMAEASPDQQDAISRGAQSATMPSWAIPALIGGGFLVLVLMMKK